MCYGSLKIPVNLSWNSWDGYNIVNLRNVWLVQLSEQQKLRTSYRWTETNMSRKHVQEKGCLLLIKTIFNLTSNFESTRMSCMHVTFARIGTYDMWLLNSELSLPNVWAEDHRCPQHPINSLSSPLAQPGAASGGVPDAAAAETEGAAAPHADGSTHIHPELTNDSPVTQPAVLSHSLTPAGRPGQQPLWPAGQCTSQARGEQHC